MAEVNNYRWLSTIPSGWTKLARKMIQECEAANPTYFIVDMKEKYGTLRTTSVIEVNDKNNSIDEIEEKYEALSARTCCQCGKPATKTSTGWILPWCDECGTKDEIYYKRFEDDSTTTNNN